MSRNEGKSVVGLAECPSCGKAIGDIEVCSYCCAATAPGRRVTEDRLMLWSLPIFALGAVLLVCAAFSETPVTPVAKLARKGAFLHFRIKGEVVRFSHIKTPYKNSDLYNFWIDDGSGRTAAESMLKLKVEGPVYQDLEELKKVPKRGDVIDVEGTYYAGDGFRLLSLNTAAMLRIVGKEGD